MEDVSLWFKWRIGPEGAELTEYTPRARVKKLTLPREINGRPVVKLGDGLFANHAELHETSLPPKLQALGKEVFRGCKGLLKLTIPAAITEIPEGLCENCSQLVEVVFPSSIEQIGARAFKGCKKLEQINEGALFSLREIGESAFEDCYAIKKFNTSQSLLAIGANAFKNCANLAFFFVQSQTSTIGSGAFSSCVRLAEFKVHSSNEYFRKRDGVLFSKDLARLYCYPAGKANEVYETPNETAIVTDQAFEGCPSLLRVNLVNVRSIGRRAFNNCASLNVAALGQAMRMIGDGAFKDCPTLEFVNIPQKSTAIRKETFSGCTGLKQIDLPGALTQIEESAFENCSSLTWITIPDGVEEIGANAFNGCSSLTRISIPSSARVIGAGAFEDCANDSPEDSLRLIEVPEGVREIGAWAFSDSTFLESIQLPRSLEKIGVGAFAFCSNLKSYDIDPQNPNFTAIDGVLFSRDLKTLICYAPGQTRRSYAVPDGTTIIAPNAFSFCENLTEITLPNSIEKIGANAFGGSSLISIEIPSGARKIPEGAFWNCRYLKSISLPEGLRAVGTRAFRGCAALTSIDFPSTLRTLDEEAFFGCAGLESVTLPKSIEEVGEGVFLKCSSLSRVEVEPGSRSYSSRNGALFAKNEREFVFYPPAAPDESYILPESVMTLAPYAFADCPKLRKLVLPRSLMEIKTEAIAPNLELRVYANSWSYKWAKNHKFRFVVVER